MWVQREPEEIRRYKKHEWLNPKMPLLYGFIIFVFIAIWVKLGIKHFWEHDNPMSWDVFFEKGVKRALPIGAGCSLIAYLWQLISKRPAKQTPFFFCIKCEKIRSSQDDSQFCDCGGEFVSLADVKWVKDGYNKSDPQHS